MTLQFTPVKSFFKWLVSLFSNKRKRIIHNATPEMKVAHMAEQQMSRKKGPRFNMKRGRYGGPTPINSHKPVLVQHADGTLVIERVPRKNVKSPWTKKGEIRPNYARGWSWTPEEWAEQKKRDRNLELL